MPYIRTCEKSLKLLLKFSFIKNEKIVTKLEVQLESLEKAYERKTQNVKKPK